jgi:TrmH family RNA methyltransferase
LIITSRQNAWFQRVRNAIREHAEEIVIEGPKPVADAQAGGWRAIAVVERAVDGEFRGRADHGERLAGDAGTVPDFSTVPGSSKVPGPSIQAGREAPVPTPTLVFSTPLFDQLAETKTPQGVLALFERPHMTPAELFSRRDGLIVALDGVQDPGNVGTIVRLAAAFGADGVALLPGCADAFGPKAIRASAGAILSVPVTSVTAKELLDCGLPLFAAAGDGTAIDPPARAAVLIFGSEGSGVSPGLRAQATAIAIATTGRVESLNVAASAAILLSRAYAIR